MMPAGDFVRAFEACTLPPEAFRHRDHVRLAWLYLIEHPLPEALSRFSRGLKRFAAALGKAGLYHETITVAYLTLVNERMARHGRAPEGGAADWDAFAAANPDLFAHPAALKPYYRGETLRSDLARAVFVLPDRLAADTETPRAA
jgi:hypothetical protein